jgi:hypothetical protein
MGIQQFHENLSYRLNESVKINNELVEKMALIAELKQIDTLRSRIHEAINCHDPNITVILIF